MTTTLEFPAAALAGLRDHLMATAADEDKAPLEELDGLSDSVLAAYWHGYVKASETGRAGQELHATAFGSALAAPMRAVCADTGPLRTALARSLK
ncbi:hypothetical protein [Streptomyces candidus]|uniref:Uncharacterized protein n=1 Tax=Streptomyces candidus TaxID=67283 RepID=A0A7X0LUA5_9ACTN|nr:hypothetical protein [Streptomyces candidus]MBB6440249.1 hypothetical protein [Streptomyces candidus]GHH57754.1 hypothetical protein GCM10018773_65570 [Streptomyces candidus]